MLPALKLVVSHQQRVDALPTNALQLYRTAVQVSLDQDADPELLPMLRSIAACNQLAHRREMTDLEVEEALSERPALLALWKRSVASGASVPLITALSAAEIGDTSNTGTVDAVRLRTCARYRFWPMFQDALSVQAVVEDSDAKLVGKWASDEAAWTFLADPFYQGMCRIGGSELLHALSRAHPRGAWNFTRGRMCGRLEPLAAHKAATSLGGVKESLGWLLRGSSTQQLEGLTELRIGGSKLGDAGAENLCGSMATCSLLNGLQTLEMWGCGIGDEGMRAFGHAVALGALPLLQSLNLYGNRIGNTGIAAFARSLCNGALPALVELNLGMNAFGDPGLTALLAACECGAFNSLATLACEENPGISAASLAAFSKLISREGEQARQGGTAVLGSLTQLILGDGSMSDDHACREARRVLQRRVLQRAVDRKVVTESALEVRVRGECETRSSLLV